MKRRGWPGEWLSELSFTTQLLAHSIPGSVLLQECVGAGRDVHGRTRYWHGKARVAREGNRSNRNRNDEEPETRARPEKADEPGKGSDRRLTRLKPLLIILPNLSGITGATVINSQSIEFSLRYF